MTFENMKGSGSVRSTKLRMLMSMSSIMEVAWKDEYEIPLKGWNIKEYDACSYIQQQFEEWFEDQFECLEFKGRTESAYASPRYCEGQDAKEEGYPCWIDFVKQWKPGLGKCTIYTVVLTRKVLNVGK